MSACSRIHVLYETSADITAYSRHGLAVVVYDERSKHLSLDKVVADQIPQAISECPYCHQPLHATDSVPHTEEPVSPGGDHGFVNPEYFRLLHHSSTESEASTNPPSPRARLLPPLLSDQIRYPAGSSIAERPFEQEHTSQHISNGAFSQDYFDKFFRIQRELGRGGKGVVYLVEHVLDGVSLGRFACKRVPCGNDRAWLEKVLSEVQLLQTLSHQNIVSYRHAWLEDYQISTFGPSVPCTFILQQYCNAGDLHEYVQGSRPVTMSKDELKKRVRTRSRGQLDPPSEPFGPKRLCFDEIFSIFKDVTSGLHYLHVNGYIHRDLKPRNCLLHRIGQRVRVLVSDFGEMQATAEERASTGYTGTISYCAPEVVQRDIVNGRFGRFTEKSDVFSLGAIVYFICFGRGPFTGAGANDDDEENEDIDLLREQISQWTGLHGARNDRGDLPDQLYTFLEMLLAVDPAQRPTTEDILKSIKIGPSSGESTLLQTSQRVKSPKRSSTAELPPGMDSRAPRWQDPAIPRDKCSDVESADKPLVRIARPRSPPQIASSLVLRHVKSDVASGEIAQPPMRLLPAPRIQWKRARFLQTTVAGNLDLQLFSRVMLFCLKVWTITKACLPLSTRPFVTTALLTVAAVDVTGRPGGWITTITLAVFHMVTVGILGRAEALCTSPLPPL